MALVAATTARAPEARAEDADAVAPPPRDVTFPFAQRTYMTSKHGPGAFAHVTPGVPAGATVPVVVYLHGMNKEGRVHPRLDGGVDDLRPVVDQLVRSGATTPFVLAAPTHVRFARSAKVMFPAFDLDAFVDAAEAALGGRARLDRARVVVVGHSGGGCNVDGGLLAAARRGRAMAALAVDTCLEPAHEEALLEAARATDLRVYWQRGWRRPFEAFAPRCEAEGQCRVEELDEETLAPGNPHVNALPVALERALPELLPPAPPRAPERLASLELRRQPAPRHP